MDKRHSVEQGYWYTQPPEGGSPTEQEKVHGPTGTVTSHSQPPEGGSPVAQEKACVSAGTMIPHSQPPEGGSPIEQEKVHGPASP